MTMLMIDPFSRWWFYVDYVIDGFLLEYSRPGGAIRGTWRILDGKGESVMVHKFGAPRMVAPACVD
jgi:hypothetical protein